VIPDPRSLLCPSPPSRQKGAPWPFHAAGPGSKRNFPDEDISEMPVTVGDERKRCSSRYIGVRKGTRTRFEAWLGGQQIGVFHTELAAAKAYDMAAVKAAGAAGKKDTVKRTSHLSAAG
jgi:hypothetical protein